MQLDFSACSHIGKVRQNNEDNLYVPGRVIPYDSADAVFTASGDTFTPCVFGVCDGMGGQEHGEYASYVAASGLAELEAAIKTSPASDIDKLVQNYVSKANNAICSKMREKSVRIGTTLALVVITSNEIRPYTIGDSRIYTLAGGNLRQISEDHTLTMKKVNMGILAKEQAKLDPDRNKLTRYLGIFEDEMVMEAEPLSPLLIHSNLPIILATDGLTDLVEDENIKKILQNAQTKDAAELLTIAALDKGGKDNISCIVINAAPKVAAKSIQPSMPNLTGVK